MPRATSPGRPQGKGLRLKGWLPEHLQANDDLTLEEHRKAFEEHFGEEVSTSTIGRAISGLPDGAWPLKKSHKIATERDEEAEGSVTVAGFSLRRQAPRVRGQVGLQDLHEAPKGEGSEREEGLRQGPQEPQQEQDPHRRDHPRRSHERADDRRRSHRHPSFRSLR